MPFNSSLWHYSENCGHFFCKKKKDAAAEFFTTNTIPLNSIILEHVEIF